MSPTKSEPKQDSDSIRRSVDSYTQTVWSLLALVHELTWDENLKQSREDVEHRHGLSHPRRNGEPVTPDLGLVVGDDYLLLGEVKMSFANDDHGRDKIAKQLLGYDEAATVLAEKREKRPTEIGTLLLTHHTRKADASDYLNSSVEFNPSNPFAVVSCVLSEQAQMFIAFERTYGTLVPTAKDEPFRKVRPVKLEHVFKQFGCLSFYDGDPPLCWVLTVLWDRIFTPLIREESFAAAAEAIDPDNKEDRRNAQAEERLIGEPESSSEIGRDDAHGTSLSRRRKAALGLTVDVARIGQILRDEHSLRVFDNIHLPGAPKQKVVQRAMQELVRLRLAEQIEGKDGWFEVQYRKLRPNTLDYFAKKLGAKPKPGGRSDAALSKRQLDFFR